MTRYIILEAPEGPDRDHLSTRFIADRFSPLALIAPFIWLLANRLWFWALAALLLQALAGFITSQQGMGMIGPLFTLGLGLLTALEGRNILASHLIAKGWQLRTVLHAHDLETAEAMWFENATKYQSQARSQRPEWAEKPSKTSPTGRPTGWRDNTTGLIGLDFSGGR